MIKKLSGMSNLLVLSGFSLIAKELAYKYCRYQVGIDQTVHISY